MYLLLLHNYIKTYKKKTCFLSPNALDLKTPLSSASGPGGASERVPVPEGFLLSTLFALCFSDLLVLSPLCFRLWFGIRHWLPLSARED